MQSRETRLDYAPRRTRRRGPSPRRQILRDFAIIMLMVLAIVTGVTIVGFAIIRLVIGHPVMNLKWGIPL